MMMPAAEEPSSSPLSVSRCSSTSAPPVDVFMASDGNMALMHASTNNNSNNFLTHLNARRWSCCGSGLDTTPPRDARLHRHRHETSPLTRFFANQSPSRGPREVSSGRAASCASTIAPHRRDTLAFMHDVVADAHHHPHTNDDDVSQEVMMDMVQYGNFLDQPLMRATDDLLLLRLSPVPHMNLASDADEMDNCAAQRDDVAAASSSSSCGTHMKMMRMKMNESSSIIPACREEVCTPVENLLRSAGQSTYLGSTEQQQQQNRSHTPRLFLSSRPTTPRKRRGRLSATGSLYSQQQQQQRSASRTSPRAVVDVAADYLAPNRNPCSPYRGDDHGCVSLDLGETHGHQHKDVVRVVDELIANTLAPAPLRHDAAVAFYAQVVPQSASLAHLQPREAQLSSCQQQQQQQQPHAASISSAASWMEEFLHPSSEVSSAISETDVTRRTSRQQPHQHLPPRIQLHTPKILPESVSPPQRRCSSNASVGSTGRDVFPLLPPPTSYTSSITQRSVWPHHHESSEGASPPSPQLTTATPRSSSVPHVHRAMVPASSQQLLLHSPHNHPQHQHQQHAHTHFPMLDASTSSHLLRSLGVLPRGMETVKSEDDGGAHSSTNMDDDDGVEDEDEDEDGAGARFRRCGRFQYLHHLPDGARCVPIHVDVNGVVWLVHNRLDGLPYAVKEVREDDVNPTEVVCLSMSSNPCVSPYHHQAETCVARFHHCVCVGRDGRGAVGMHNSAVRLIQTEFFPRGTVWENVLDPFGKRTSSSSTELCFADVSTCAWRRILVHALMGLASLHGSSLVHGCPLLFNLFYADDAHVKWANFGSSVMHPHHHHQQQQQQHVQRWLSVEMMKRIQTEEVSPYDTEVAVFCCGVFMLMLACDMRARGDLSRDDLLQQNPWEWLRVCRKEMQQYFFMMENEVPTTASPSSSSSSMKKMIAELHPDRQQLWEVIRVGATQPRSAALLLQLLHPPSMEMFSTTLMLDREIQRLLQLVAANTHATTTTTTSSPEDNIARTRMMPMNAESSSAAASVSEHSGGGGGCCCLDHVRTSSTCAQRLAIFPRARGMAEQRLRATSSREPQWLILQVQAIIFHAFDDDDDDDDVGASTTTVASSCTFRPPSWADVRPLCCRETLPQRQHTR